MRAHVCVPAYKNAHKYMAHAHIYTVCVCMCMDATTRHADGHALPEYAHVCMMCFFTYIRTLNVYV
jgi:hypothetical protein